MIALSPGLRFYLYSHTTDMRKSFDGLSGLVTQALSRDPMSGDVHVFRNRRRDRMKLLLWDRTGFWLFYTRLEQGTLQLPSNLETQPSLELRYDEKAIGYLLGQWPKLEQSVTDGRLEIDNNLVENAIRPVALGRKHYLFAGLHAGAKRAAMIYTLVATAKLHQVDPLACLRDILSRPPDHPITQIAALLPQNWRTPTSCDWALPQSQEAW
ncbi:MAG: IS66 family insertion sequence element accessory protein TnpB [candidate division KSB1 bacterium]|nr:IS66 family insertion sequence element accessory protein TnpB [candidate division KSB1 bacterium]MDZ7274410.1 IS66 family insertion sequence element accessory protein TnpB [candidate division KSB1 bacterium]MDZ7284928.1 IS66 family insertion sequence element accessory protein TnpB [candidate division KSB1 bacterium]MDZ7297651.1 IS66 family insertion sequence element accessory protein TnpB [candidate division KSB1 bacterium]MDZ7308616.1 IS66 family insertion sequence element accessory protein